MGEIRKYKFELIRFMVDNRLIDRYLIRMQCVGNKFRRLET